MDTFATSGSPEQAPYDLGAAITLGNTAAGGRGDSEARRTGASGRVKFVRFCGVDGAETLLILSSSGARATSSARSPSCRGAPSRHTAPSASMWTLSLIRQLDLWRGGARAEPRGTPSDPLLSVYEVNLVQAAGACLFSGMLRSLLTHDVQCAKVGTGSSVLRHSHGCSTGLHETWSRHDRGGPAHLVPGATLILSIIRSIVRDRYGVPTPAPVVSKPLNYYYLRRYAVQASPEHRTARGSHAHQSSC